MIFTRQRKPKTETLNTKTPNRCMDNMALVLARLCIEQLLTFNPQNPSGILRISTSPPPPTGDPALWACQIPAQKNLQKTNTENYEVPRALEVKAWWKIVSRLGDLHLHLGRPLSRGFALECNSVSRDGCMVVIRLQAPHGRKLKSLSICSIATWSTAKQLAPLHRKHTGFRTSGYLIGVPIIGEPTNYLGSILKVPHFRKPPHDETCVQETKAKFITMERSPPPNNK